MKYAAFSIVAYVCNFVFENIFLYGLRIVNVIIIRQQ